MLEYHTGKSSQELAQQEETPPGRKTKYTCLNCNRPISSTIGKFNHIRRYPECQNASHRETIGNKCNDCSRAFKAPVKLEENQKFVCADIRETMLTQEKPKTRENEQENGTKETEPGNLNHTYGRPRHPKESGKMQKEH